MSIGQCSIIINFRLNRNSNIFANFSHQIRISNIFVIRQLTEYEYRIYSFLATWPNTNIEYIRSRKTDRIRISNIFETGKLSIRIRISNIRCQIFEYLNLFVLHWNITTWEKDLWSLLIISHCGRINSKLGLAYPYSSRLHRGPSVTNRKTRHGLQCQTPASYLSWTISFG